MKKIFLSAAIAAIALFSCNKEKTTEIGAEPVAVQFSNGVITRASGTEWAAGDQIGVFMFETQTTTPYGSNANIAYSNTTDAGQTATFEVVDPSQTIYYPIDGTHVDFLGYYPFSDSKVDATTCLYQLDVNSQADLTLLDLLISRNLTDKAVNTAALAFSFSHALSQLSVVVNEGDGSPSLDGLEITVDGLINSASYDLTSDIIDFGSEVSTTLNVLNENAIVIPQVSDVSFTVKTADNPAGFETGAKSVTFEAGKQTTVTLTLNRTSANFEGDSTINDWEDSSVNPDFDAE